ncbi:MAG: Mov34/MPN/PAD-1 family protein [Candidatus Limnocylindrales bacterium]
MFPILEAGAPLDGATLPAFLVARDGLYLRKRSLLGLSQTRAGRVAHLPEGSEFVDYALPPVPADLVARAAGLFRAVWRARKTEAAVLLLWRDGSFDLAVPRQRVTSVTVKFDIAREDLPRGSRLVGTMHSHGAYGAFASSTDEDDEAGLDGLHVVVGDLDRRTIGYAAAVVVDGTRFRLPVGRLIERPRRLVEPPDGWVAKVRVAPPPRRPTKKPSMAEFTRRGFKPADEISKPSRRDLEDAIERAGKLAGSLGYRLSTYLVPVSPPAETEGTGDA